MNIRTAAVPFSRVRLATAQHIIEEHRPSAEILALSVVAAQRALDVRSWPRMADPPAQHSRPEMTMIDWIAFVVTGLVVAIVVIAAVLALLPAVLILTSR